MSIYLLLKFILAGINIGVWISSAGLNNLVRSYLELGSAREKFVVQTKFSAFYGSLQMLCRSIPRA